MGPDGQPDQCMPFMYHNLKPSCLSQVCSLPHPIFKITATQLVTHENVKSTFRDLRWAPLTQTHTLCTQHTAMSQCSDCGTNTCVSLTLMRSQHLCFPGSPGIYGYPIRHP